MLWSKNTKFVFGVFIYPCISVHCWPKNKLHKLKGNYLDVLYLRWMVLNNKSWGSPFGSNRQVHPINKDTVGFLFLLCYHLTGRIKLINKVVLGSCKLSLKLELNPKHLCQPSDTIAGCGTSKILGSLFQKALAEHKPTYFMSNLSQDHVKTFFQCFAQLLSSL